MLTRQLLYLLSYTSFSLCVYDYVLLFAEPHNRVILPCSFAMFANRGGGKLPAFSHKEISPVDTPNAFAKDGIVNFIASNSF